jgi:hypothetical protein
MSATGNIPESTTYLGVVSPFNGTVDITLTLPGCSDVKEGAIIIVKDETGLADNSPNGAIIIAPAGADTINGAGSSIKIENPRQSVWLIGDGVTNWEEFL